MSSELDKLTQDLKRQHQHNIENDHKTKLDHQGELTKYEMEIKMKSE